MRSLLWLVWAALAVILGWTAISYKAPAIQQDILTRSTEAVKPLNANAEVVVDGRFVTLRGPEPSEDAKSKTLSAADDVRGALGPWDGLWVPVAAAATKAVEFFSADKAADGKLTLAGSVPSDEAKAAVEDAAKASFTGEIDNQLTVSGTGGPTTLQGIADALKSLGSLDTGSLLALPDRFRLSGKTADQAVADAADALATADPAKWGVFVQGPATAAPAAAPAAPPVEPIAHFNAVKTPNGGIVASGEVASEAERGSLLDTLRGMAGGATVIDRLSVRDQGLPDGWGDRIASGFKALSGLDWGSLTLDGAQSYLNGSGAADKIGALVGDLGSGWTSDVTPTPTDPDTVRISELETAVEKAQDDGKAALAKAQAEAEAARAAIEDAAKAAAAKLQGETDGRAKTEADLQTANAKIAELQALLAAKPAAPAPVQSGAPANDQVKACNDAMANVMSGKTIEFATARANITANGMALIDAIAAEAKPCLSAGLLVTVTGHTDDDGSDDQNMVLSERRADAVKAALVERGLPAADITTQGYGETRPIATNETPEGRAQNRRIAFDWFVR